jgi:hypothetical protein
VRDGSRGAASHKSQHESGMGAWTQRFGRGLRNNFFRYVHVSKKVPNTSWVQTYRCPGEDTTNTNSAECEGVANVFLDTCT